MTTPLLFKLIPAVVHLGVLLRWFSPDSSSEVNNLPMQYLIIQYAVCIEPTICFRCYCFKSSILRLLVYGLSSQIGFKGDNLRSDSVKRIALIVQGSHDS